MIEETQKPAIVKPIIENTKELLNTKIIEPTSEPITE